MIPCRIRAESSDSFLIEREGVELRLPFTPAGLHFLRTILLALPGTKISTPEFPTQAQLDRMVSNWKQANPPQFQINLKELDL